MVSSHRTATLGPHWGVAPCNFVVCRENSGVTMTMTVGVKKKKGDRQEMIEMKVY